MSEGQAFVMTPAGFQRLQQELSVLQEKRREVLEQMRDNKPAGDLAENPEYEEARVEQALVESRINDLKEIVGSAVVLDFDQVSTDRVGVGSVVRVRELPSNEEWRLTVVSSFEADPDEDRISSDCPIGQALVGRRPGEVVEVQVPAGLVSYEVLGIERPAA